MKGTVHALFTVATNHHMCYKIIGNHIHERADHVHNRVDHVHNSTDHIYNRGNYMHNLLRTEAAGETSESKKQKQQKTVSFYELRNVSLAGFWDVETVFF